MIKRRTRVDDKKILEPIVLPGDEIFIVNKLS